MKIKPTDPVINSGVAANKLGISRQLIKKYEDDGLVITHKTSSGHKLFSQRDLNWLEYIHQQMTPNNLKGAGLRLLLGLVPCWEIKKDCNESDCKSCKAYKNYKVICWKLDDPGSKLCSEGHCRSCEVYCYATDPNNLKKITAKIERTK